MKLDIDFVRAQFDQIQDDPDFVFACNAGGSYVSNQVNHVMEHYNHHSRVQPYSDYPASTAAGAAMDRAHQGWAQALNIDPTELTVGPSTSINTYVMAQAMGPGWQQGDEIIVTNQDHEANSGVWRRKALERGVKIQQWEVDADSGLLDVDRLTPLLSERTRAVFFTHCSNVVGTANPVADITRSIKAVSAARVCVDAVAYAPHHICDLKALGVDVYVFSLYKVFGPHQSLLYVNAEMRDELTSQAHYFNNGIPGKDYNPAGPQHAQVAACAGVLDYFADLYRHHFGESQSTRNAQLQQLHELMLQHENELAAPILDFVHNHPGLQLIGKSHTRDNDRAPTIAFRPLQQSSAELTHKLQQQGIGTEHGNFYAHRLIKDLGIDTVDGVVRLSLVHYGSQQDVERILAALDRATG